MKTTPSKTLPSLAAAALTLASGAAWAHAGADAGVHHGFAAGLAHPFTGLDHLAAMLAIGFWSVLGSRRPWAAPLAFAAMLLVGALLGLAGIAVPAIEPMIAASLVAVGLLVAARPQLPAAAAAALVGLFALFHGAAHGVELAGDGAAAALAGMLAGTVVLHLAGMAAGSAVRTRSAWWPRAAGAAVAGFGAVLLAPMLLG